MRNISSFGISIRKGDIKITLPEHVPAFQHKKHLKRQTLDPRVYVIIGDSPTALSAVDALRSNFTGNIVLIPQSQYGAFENTDAMVRKFKPLTNNEVFLEEDDFLDRANVTVIRGKVKFIDIDQKFL